jgi:hypothetical protein
MDVVLVGVLILQGSDGFDVIFLLPVDVFMIGQTIKIPGVRLQSFIINHHHTTVMLWS